MIKTVTEEVSSDGSMEHGWRGGGGTAAWGGGGLGGKPSNDTASLTKVLVVRTKGRGRAERVCMGLTELLLQ